MQRRNFLKTGASLLGALPFTSLSSFTMASPTNTTIEATHRFRIGQIKCAVLHDNLFTYQAKDFFTNADPTDVEKALKGYRQTTSIASPFVALLLETDSRKILVDTGAGSAAAPNLADGKLLALLKQEGIRPEAITDVVITHFHPDHIGGIFNEKGQLNFPNALFHYHATEWDYWHTSKSDHQPSQFKYFIEKNITKLKDKNVQLIKGDMQEILPGVTSVIADGHTPGQVALQIDSEGQSLLYISDAFLHPLHIENLHWQTSYDLEHEKARQTRIKLLEMAYKESMLVQAFHFDFPGLGHVDKMGDRWIWKSSAANKS